MPDKNVEVYNDIVTDIYSKHNVSEENQKAIKKLFKPILPKEHDDRRKGKKDQDIRKAVLPENQHLSHFAGMQVYDTFEENTLYS